MSTFASSRLREALQSRTLRKVAIRVVLPVASCAFVLGFNPVLAREDGDDGHTSGDASVFATTPFPGHPFGVAVDAEADRVYVSTSRGDFFAQQTNSAGERVFAFDLQLHDPGLLYFGAEVAKDGDSEAVLAEIDRVVEQFAQNGPTEAEMSRGRNALATTVERTLADSDRLTWMRVNRSRSSLWSRP